MIGLIQATDEAAGVTGAVNTKYFVVAHYTRHVRPGFEVLSVTSSADDVDTDFGTVAAFHNTSSTLVIISGNTGSSEVTRVFDLSKLFNSSVGGNGPKHVQNWRTQINGKDRYSMQVCL